MRNPSLTKLDMQVVDTEIYLRSKNKLNDFFLIKMKELLIFRTFKLIPDKLSFLNWTSND